MSSSSPSLPSSPSQGAAALMIAPTADRPWAVGAVAAMPVRVTSTTSATRSSMSFLSPVDSCIASCCMGQWTCLLSKQHQASQQQASQASQHQHQSYQYVLHLWFTYAHLDMCQQKLSQPVLSFTHSSLLYSSNSNMHAPPLVAIYVSPVQPECVYVYVACNTNTTGGGGGAVLLYKFSTLNLQRSNSGNGNNVTIPPVKDVCQLPLMTTFSSFAGQEENDSEYITSISVEWKQVVVGTSHGRLFWLRQFQNSLRAQLVQTAENNDSAASRSSLFSRLLFGSGGKYQQDDDHGYNKNSSVDKTAHNGAATAICHILQVPQAQQAPSQQSAATTTTPGKTASTMTTSHFFSLTRAGSLQYWTVTKPQEHAPKETFQSTHLLHLRSLLQGASGGGGANKMMIIPPFSSLETLRAVYQRGHGSNTSCLHVLVRIHHEQHDECRLYWLRLQEQQPNHAAAAAAAANATTRASPSLRGGGTTATPTFVLKMVLWLNRFVLPETVLPIGLVAAENGITYAAFGVQSSNSGSSNASSVSPTLMALLHVDDDDDNGDDHDQHDTATSATTMIHMTTTTTCSQLYEIDLHQVEALIVDSLIKDDRTHGCIVATTGGLFLRAECKISMTSSSSSSSNIRSSRSSTSSSPTSTALARRRITLLKNHLRSTFWDAFERGSHGSSFASSAMDATLAATTTTTPAAAAATGGGGARFWSPTVPRSLPPSLKTAEPMEMGQVVTQLAMELQHDMHTTSTTSAMDIYMRHLDFLEFLHQASIYRSLPVLATWHLLVIGQEIAAYKALYDMMMNRRRSSASSAAMAALFEAHPLNTKNVALWLETVQIALYEPKAFTDADNDNVDDSTTGGTNVEVLQVAWLECFVTAIRAATLYSEERAAFTYGITSENNGTTTTTTTAPTPPCTQTRESVPIWTSKVALQRTFQRQLQYWQQSSSSSSSSLLLFNDDGNNNVVSYGDLVQAVATAALQSFADSYRTIHPNSLAARLLAKSDYEAVQVQAIELLRKIKKPTTNNSDNDELAWLLSKEHCYFSGLCQIAMDHEKVKTENNPFQLDAALFKELAFCQDLKTGLGFGRFVIKWHVEHNFLGHALQYGKHCPIDLSFLVQEEPALRPFQWVAAIRHEDFSTATQSLLNNVVQGGGDKENDDGSDNHLISLSQAKFSLGMAKLANQVVLQEEMPGSVSKDMAIDREQSIETMRELASAQEQLMGGNKSKMSTGAFASLWPPLKLLDYALDKVDECIVRDDKIDTCFIALVICTAIPNKNIAGGTTNNAIQEAAARVWCKALMTDTELLRNLMPQNSTTADSSSSGDNMEMAFHQSIFGSLVEKCNQVDKWKRQQQQNNHAPGICLDAAMERQILDCLDGAERPLFQGLLRHALSHCDRSF